MRPFVHIGLIVTGRGEARFLLSFFRALTPSTPDCLGCHFAVIARFGQLNEIKSEKRKAKMVRTGQAIPNKDQNIGHDARLFLGQHPSSFVILVDDFEHDRRDCLDAIYLRYRAALDTVKPDWRWRTSVHFFVNMLEAYYFADSRAVNAALVFVEFDEVEHGEQIVRKLDLEHVLAIPDRCAALRSLVAWRRAGAWWWT